ncbi:FtsH protease activity modulator HflK [Rhodoferax sp. 4810]|uniref:Protein HflK n=1 Tax=Thiospirillum jenense TaxID=1653858 RepID=A0A839HA78_9GAMM|nr:FtsH protease activity modulator HflK [Thiospirillum jenense]MBB1076149.1 FtsH protease activity modulator HflK [Rhodoferax jenense]MBB1126065.1 FtsH protease activity modulator HflK [Thiospirillum jenense]
MAWNEPGGGNKDPWGNHQGNQVPPDFDEIIRNLNQRITQLFGGGGHTGRGDDEHVNWRIIILLIAVLITGWLLSGIYIVDPAERGVVLRFGAYTTVTEPGPHWRIPWPIESVQVVNVDEISSFSHKASMLTQDENIVDVELTVQSRIQDAAYYLFQDQNPEKTLRDATETVVRKTIGGSKLDFILTEGRGAIAVIIQERVQDLMDQYRTGLLVTSVNMQPAKPPDEVKEAFDDAIKAREDKERLENKAEAYSNEILPQARGEAARASANAKAYRDRVIAEAQGEASRFLAVLAEYKKAPEVTRERLYLETIEGVFAHNHKVLVDVPGGNNVFYLPLEQLTKQSSSSSIITAPTTEMIPTDEGRIAPPLRDVMRDRERRLR